MPEQQQLAAAENFRGLLNDLKRRPQDAARELGTSVDEITAILEGHTAIRPELVRRATEIWPVNERDFYLLRDDCPNGVRIMRAEESKASSRIMARAGKPYYDYRDTAMSSVAQFRPEWIQELCVVTDNDPDNPAVQWNNGHFLHQFTYFVGPVNFYYKGADGKKAVAVMNTGDSMYITPFTPHSFTTRANPSNELGLILALTYGASLAGEAHQELAVLGTELASGFAMDYSSPAKAAGELLRAHRNACTMSVAELASRSGIEAAQISRFENGGATPSPEEYERFAEALAVDLRDLLPPDAVADKVVVRHHNEGRCWTYPDEDVRYQIVELASTRSLPWSKGLEITLRHTQSADLDLQVGLHQYGYNLGDHDVTLLWSLNGVAHHDVLRPGDSFYMKPFVKHAFRGVGQVLSLRIGGRLAGQAQRELSNLSAEHLSRVMSETEQWFNPEGRTHV